MNHIKQTRADQNDLNTAIMIGALVIGWLLFDSIRNLVGLFGTPGAMTVTTRVPAQEITASIGTGAPATIDSATLVATDVNLISIICLVLTIVLRAIFLISATVLGVVVCRRLMRGILFDRLNSRVTFVMSITLLAAALAPSWFENMGLNGVFAALGGEFDGQWLLLAEGAPLVVTSIALGVLVIVFRRGATLQRDTEGLV